jgi:2-aminoadipate transaminase
MFPLALDPASEVPLYRQLFGQLREQITSGQMAAGERLPATRELAGSLGLNRATVTAAYELLEVEGLISGQVGRGSFVLERRRGDGVAWSALMREAPLLPGAAPGALLSFATSRPPEDLFPLELIRLTCNEVMESPSFPAVLQLGAPSGYEPLRQFLLEEARRRSVAGGGDDLLITSGCQQALDLLTRVLVRPGDSAAVEDPVYPGLKNLFLQAGAKLAAMPVGECGIDPAAMRESSKVAVVTPSFQNPTGATMTVEARKELVRRAREFGTVLVENDIYSSLCYEGQPLAPLKQFDEAGDVVMLGSFSKIAFPGLRVGWAIGPKALIARMTAAKQLADLHTDQFSQAVLLRFAESGRLEEHHGRMLAAGAERLRAVMDACAAYLPQGTRFTRPSGGMNLWVRLPEPLDAHDLLPRAQRENVAYLPGRYFAVARVEPGALRLSFASLAPGQIREGVEILGRLFTAELSRDTRPEMAMV